MRLLKLQRKSAFFNVSEKMLMLEKRSLGLFSEKNPLRVKALELVKREKYELYFNLFVVLASIVIAFRDGRYEVYETTRN